MALCETFIRISPLEGKHRVRMGEGQRASTKQSTENVSRHRRAFRREHPLAIP